MLRTVVARLVLVGRVATPLAALAVIAAWAFGVTAVPLSGRDRPLKTAYAHVYGDGRFDRALNVVEVVEGTNPNEYCFDLAFKPKVAVASPFVNNDAVVGTWTRPDAAVGFGCPLRADGLPWDAAAQVFAADDTGAAQTGFKIVFH